MYEDFNNNYSLASCQGILLFIFAVERFLQYGSWHFHHRFYSGYCLEILCGTLTEVGRDEKLDGFILD